MKTHHDFEPGDIVSVRFGGVLRHYGVVTFGGRVVSNNGKHGGVISQSITEFADGRRIKRHGRAQGDPYLTDARARSNIGQDYHLTGSNCIDFTRHTHSHRKTPWLVARATMMAVGDMIRGR